jgi:hypothetical protein
MHAAHRQEEIQHLPTNRELVRSLGLTDQERSRFTRFLLHGSLRTLRFSTGLDTAYVLVREQFPDLAPFDRNAGRDPLDHTFKRVIQTHPSFAATRSQPGFDNQA